MSEGEKAVLEKLSVMEKKLEAVEVARLKERDYLEITASEAAVIADVLMEYSFVKDSRMDVIREWMSRSKKSIAMMRDW